MKHALDKESVMSEQLTSQSDTSSLDSLTLALVVSGLGFYTDETVADLLATGPANKRP